MSLTQIIFLKLNVPRFSFLSGFSSTTFPLVNPQLDVREGPEFRTKIDERKILLYISLCSGNTDGSERMGQSLLLFFNEHSSIRHTSVGRAERGFLAVDPYTHTHTHTHTHTSSMMALLIHYHETIWRRFTSTRLEQ